METSPLFPANESDQELYTIPSRSSWFSWNEIHETEKTSLKEFFTGCNISKSPKIYKEYRDFIINKYREQPTRRLKFTEIRKLLIGDVNLIHKVFVFLENWGLINFAAAGKDVVGGEEVEKHKVVYEEGAPNGVRVAVFPSSAKVVTLPPVVVGKDGEGVENGFRLPSLASYSDVFGDLMQRKRLSCAKCGEVVAAEDQESNKKESIVICSKCSEVGKNEGPKTLEDVKQKESKDRSDTWTDAEALLLLESVLLHGDNWDLVAERVGTKSKSDCISKLIDLPFGELMLATTTKGSNSKISNTQTNNISEDQPTPAKTKPEKAEDLGEAEAPTKKRKWTDSFANASDSLMRQVAELGTTVSPHIAAVAADSAITALCDENPYARMLIEGEDGSTESGEENNSACVTLRIRTAIATAFGAAAVHAKLLADQEDREIEHLVATVIDTQLRKMEYKVKHFEELESIMDKEYTQIQEIKETLMAERIDVLRSGFHAGIPRWKDHSSSLKI
ncbi:hypothetical protein ACHQM5_010386 [Ranunculus cassubicifolius]